MRQEQQQQRQRRQQQHSRGGRWLAVAIAAATALLLTPGVGVAQFGGERYQIGVQLRLFEQLWESKTDEAGRKRTIEPLNRAFRSFFGGRPAEVARALFDARHALDSDQLPDPATLWAESLAIEPVKRLIDPTEPIRFRVRPFFTGKLAAPDAVTVGWTWFNPDSKQTLPGKDTPLGKLPAEIELPKPANEQVQATTTDCELLVRIAAGGKKLIERKMIVSVAPRLQKRLAALRGIADEPPAAMPSLEQATLQGHVAVLAALAEGQERESDYPAARLLREAEELARVVQQGGEYFNATRAGQTWLTVPTQASPTVVRLLVPASVAQQPKQAVPLLVALHGAGGSENLFFEGYGNGVIVRECEKRGWLLVAPRGPQFLGSPPVEEIIDTLAKRYPVDPKRIYLVGHSMGAGQALALSQKSPGRYAGVAALGGAGATAKLDVYRTLPLFVGTGKEDFVAVKGARGLANRLDQLGARFSYREYADIEHMMIVPAALPDLFRFFENPPAAK
jgi:predicted esterase